MQVNWLCKGMQLYTAALHCCRNSQWLCVFANEPTQQKFSKLCVCVCTYFCELELMHMHLSLHLCVSVLLIDFSLPAVFV